MGFPGGASGKEPACQFRRCERLRFNPWVGKSPWNRKWQPTPASLPGEPHGQRSLAGYSPWGHKESDRTEATENALEGRRRLIRADIEISRLRLYTVLGSNLEPLKIYKQKRYDQSPALGNLISW